MTTFTRYPVYVPSRGRVNNPLTIESLQRDKVPFYVVTTEAEAPGYAELVGAGSVLTLPEPVPSAAEGGLVFTRNWIKQHAMSEGHARHWQLDDNIRGFYRWRHRRRIRCSSDVALSVCEDLTDRYENVAISGLAYTMFMHSNSAQGKNPFTTNVHVYSCVAPDTPVLCADLTWRAAGDLEVGQEIMAFDEEPDLATPRQSRSYRTAVVKRNEPVQKPCLAVETDIGVPVVASAEHPWLVWRGSEAKRNGTHRSRGEVGGRHQLCWVRTEDLRPGDQIAHLGRPWERDESHDGGWISGMFDGEGSLVLRADDEGRTKGAGIGIAQRSGFVLERLAAALRARGYATTDKTASSVNGAGGLSVLGGFAEMLRFAGEFQPTRINGRARSIWEGRRVWRGSTYQLATVVAVTPVGPCEVASITTSAGTFITGGYLTHNCTLVRSDEFRWRGVYNDDTDMCLQVLAAGECTLLINAFMANKTRTTTLKGGNTEIYVNDDGRLKMARELERRWPGVVLVTRRFGRAQHYVDWRKFSTALVKRPDYAAIVASQEDRYRSLRLRQVTPDVRSSGLQELLERENAADAAGSPAERE